MLSIIVLLISNILTITNERVHDSLYSLLSHVPYENLFSKSKYKKYSELKNKYHSLIEIDDLRKAKISKARDLSTKIIRRTVKNAALNVTSVVGEAAPIVGTGLIVAVTIADVSAACETITDTNELLVLLEEEKMNNEQASVCGMSVPSAVELKNNIFDTIGGTMYQIVQSIYELRLEWMPPKPPMK